MSTKRIVAIALCGAFFISPSCSSDDEEEKINFEECLEDAYDQFTECLQEDPNNNGSIDYEELQNCRAQHYTSVYDCADAEDVVQCQLDLFEEFYSCRASGGTEQECADSLCDDFQDCPELEEDPYMGLYWYLCFG